MSEMLFEYPSLFEIGKDGKPANRVDFSQLQPLIEKKFVLANRHPELPYTIYNYSATRVQRMDRPEDPIIDHCRGIIVDDSGFVVARPFSRMTELGEHDELPEGMQTVFEKIDGGLGVQYIGPEGDIRMASRGSFVSSQAVIGTAMLQQYKDYPFDPNLTYLWEMVSPEMKQVVDYEGLRRITLLGTLVTATGVEVPLPDPSELPFPIVKTFEGEEFTSAASMRALDWPNAEGFVVRKDGGEHAGERFKVKLPGYRWLNMERNGEIPNYIREKVLASKPYKSIIYRVPPSVRPMMTSYVNEFKDEVEFALEPILAALRGEDVELTPQQQQVLGTMHSVGRATVIKQIIKPPKRRQGRNASGTSN